MNMVIQRATTKELLASSYEDLLGKRKYTHVSITDIVSNCGLSRQTFYNHFLDINDLVYWIYCRDVINITGKINGTDYTWENATLDTYYMFRERSEFYKAALQYSGQNSIKDFAFPWLETECLRIINQKWPAFEPDDTFIFSLRFFLKGTYSVISDWILENCPETPELMTERILSCMPEDVRNYLL